MSEAPEESGKATLEAAEAAYDDLAEKHGIDVNGDEIVEDDGPVLEATEEEAPEVDEPAIDDAPAIDAGQVEAEPETLQELVEEALLAPHTWPEEWKDAFAGLTEVNPEDYNPRQLQQMLLDQNQNMTKAFTQKTQGIAEERRELSGIRNSLQPHHERLQRAGIPPDVAIQRSLAWDAHIQRDPVQGIMDMAHAYGVDLAATVQSNTQEEQYLTPFERQLRDENQGLRQNVQQVSTQMQQWQQMQQNQEWQGRQSNAHAMLDEFMNAKDEAGNQMHPYIEHVAPRMTQLIQENRLGLDQAYMVATSENPQIQQAREKSRKAQLLRDNKAKAQKVRQASRSGIVGKSSGTGQASAMTAEQQVEAAYDQIANAR